MNIDRGLLSVENLVKHFDISGGMLDQLSFNKGRLIRKRTTVKAVNQVSFTIHSGETLSVVGESGCGKSPLARTIMARNAVPGSRTISPIGWETTVSCTRQAARYAATIRSEIRCSSGAEWLRSTRQTDILL